MKIDTIKFALREYAETLLLAIFIAIVFRVFLFSTYKIPSDSMMPNLLPGDQVVAYKPPYGFKLPLVDKRMGSVRAQRGEVVAFSCPGGEDSRCIKRIVGLPGDRIEIVNTRLFVNDIAAKYSLVEETSLVSSALGKVLLKEIILGTSYNIQVSSGTNSQKFGPVIVPPGHVFVLADSRENLYDSRSWGPIPIDKIDAKVLILFWPGHPPAGLKNSSLSFWSRLFKLVH